MKSDRETLTLENRGHKVDTRENERLRRAGACAAGAIETGGMCRAETRETWAR